jgi:hypothetical protein
MPCPAMRCDAMRCALLPGTILLCINPVFPHRRAAAISFDASWFFFLFGPACCRFHAVYTTMIVSRFSLAAAASVRLLLLFSLLLLSAAPARSTTATQATVATTLSSASITSPAVASATSLSAALPSPSYFSAPFGIPPQIVLDQPAIFNYTLPYTTQSPGLVLCQTNATDSDPISTANTWIVLLVPLSG